jgi:ankyrin repeat protein
MRAVTLKQLVLIFGALALAACQHREADLRTPLMEAAYRGDAVQVRAMIAAGADVNKKRGVHMVRGAPIHGDNPQHGETALLFGAKSGEAEVLRALLDAGAAIDAKDSAQFSVWYYMSDGIGEHRGTEAVRLLLGRSPNKIPGADANLILSAATQAGNEEIVRMMLEHRGDPAIAYCVAGRLDLKKFFSMMALLEKHAPAPPTTLFCAVDNYGAEKLEYFLARGADPNLLHDRFRPLTSVLLKNWQPGPPLTNQRRRMVDVLLRYGADPNLTDGTDGGSAIDRARVLGDPEIVRALSQSKK